MSKEPSDVAELVGLVSMDRVVVLLESVLEVVGPDSVEFTKPLSDETKELRVGSFLRTTFDNHVAQLALESSQ